MFKKIHVSRCGNGPELCGCDCCNHDPGVQTALLKDIIFEHVIIDETSVLTHVEMLCASRGNEVLTLIGDTKQLHSTLMNSPDQNPFAIVLSCGSFQRFADLGLCVSILQRVMRMTAGLEELYSEILYNGKWLRGPGTFPTDLKRHLWRSYLAYCIPGFPEFQKAPAKRIYPVFLDITGTC